MYRLFLIGVFSILCYAACMFPIKLSRMTIQMCVLVSVFDRVVAVSMTAMGVLAPIRMRMAVDLGGQTTWMIVRMAM
jgi:hypothetical protein